MGLVIGVAVAVGGTLVAWISAWFLYGFGELIDRTCNISDKLDALADPVIKEQKRVAEEEKAAAWEKAKADRAANTERKPVSQQSTNVSKKEPQQMSTKEHLEYAIRFETDFGMLSYLKSIQDPVIEELLNRPEEEVREAIKQAIEQM